MNYKFTFYLLLFITYCLVCPSVIYGFTYCYNESYCDGQGSASYSHSAKQCYLDIAGNYACEDASNVSGSHKCVPFGWNSGSGGGMGCDGCGFEYAYSTCTDASCESNNGGETWVETYKYCCTAKSGSCDSGGSYCTNPGNCNRGTAINESRSGGTWTWNCTGTCGGSTSSQCTASVTTPVNSVCGNAEDREYKEPDSPVGAADLCGPNNSVYWTTAQNNDCKNWCNNDSSKEYYRWLCKGACNEPVKCSAKNDAWPRAVTPQLYRDPAITPAEDEPEPTPVSVNTYNGVSINNICQTAFDGSLRVLWRLTINDANGIDDIKAAQLRFVPTNGGDTFMSVVETPVNGVADFIMNTSLMTAATYRVEYQLEDKDNPPGKGPWTYSTRDFKAWDCMVGIGGTFYDSSGLTKKASCLKKDKYRGYTDLISDQLNFGWSYGMVNRTSELEVVDVAVSSPYYSSNNETSRKLKWSDDSEKATYSPISKEFPGQLVSQTRVNNTTCLSTSLLLDLSKLVSPYADNPSIKADYTGKMSQDTWFSVSRGQVFARGKINNSVPVTCKTNCRTSVNGIVWTRHISSTLSKYDDTKVDKREYYNKPVPVIDDMNTYDYKYFTDLGIGTSVVGNEITLWSDIKNLTGMIMVDGDLSINEDIISDQFRMIVVKGALDIGTSVNEVDAVLVADEIDALGISNNQLKIVGSVYASSSVDFRRSFPTVTQDGSESKNNTTPAVLVQYDPRIIGNMPTKLSTSVNRWQND